MFIDEGSRSRSPVMHDPVGPKRRPRHAKTEPPPLPPSQPHDVASSGTAVNDCDDWDMVHPEIERKTPDWVSNTMWHSLNRIRETKPLIQCVTNFVSTDIIASGLLSLNCSPVFFDDTPPSDTYHSQPSCVYINIGTLTTNSLTSMLRVAHHASTHNIPIVLDVVSCMFTDLRTFAATSLIGMQPSVIICNYKELRVLITCCCPSLSSASFRLIPSVIVLSRVLRCPIAIVDPEHGSIVSDGVCTLQVRGAHRLFSALGSVASGRSLVSAVVAAFVAVNELAVADSRLPLVVAHAIAFMCCCYESACAVEGKRVWAGGLRTALVDEMFLLGEKSKATTQHGRIVDVHWAMQDGESEEDWHKL